MVHPGWRYHPAAKIALLLAAGIGAARLLRPSTEGLLLSVSLFALTLFILSFLRDSRTVRLLFASLLALLIVTSGGLLFATRGGYQKPLLPPGVSIDRLNLVGTIVEGPRTLASGGVEWRLRVDSAWRRGIGVSVGSDLLLRSYRSPRRRREFVVGDVVLTRGNLQTPSRAGIPAAFDYGAWLQRQGIFGIVTIKGTHELTRLGSAPPERLDRLIAGFRASVRRYAARNIGGEEGVIATALLTGDRREIDPELRESFSATGTAHVLALSGLHVGALALLLFVLLSWVPGRWLRLALFILVLGSYAVITGGSPSILRASLMASFFALAYTIGRVSQPLNTLGLAALVLLLVDPLSLFDVGFQLSFGAVAGILLFYGRIYRSLERHLSGLLRLTKPRSIIQLFILSLTAQVGTFPLVALYFGEFSLLSPLLNIVVVPLITIGFGAAGVGYLFSWAPAVAGVYGATAYLAIGGVIDLVSGVKELSWQGISLPALSAGVVTLSLAGVLWIGMARRAGSLFFRALVVGTLFLLSWIAQPLSSGRESEKDGLYIAPLTRRSGVAVMVVTGDTLKLWYASAWESDSVSAARLVERYGSLFRAEQRIITALRGPRVDTGTPSLIPVNGIGPEYVVRGVPLLLSMTERRRVDVVKIGGERVVQIGLHGRVGRVLRVEPVDLGEVVRSSGASTSPLHAGER